MRHRNHGLTFIAVSFSLDQVSKALALGTSALDSGVELLPVLNLVLVHNDGVSFGMFSGVASWWTLTLLGLFIVSVLSIWLLRSQSWLLSIALGLMIGGALGNLLDRFRYGAVTDFLDFHVSDYHWPVFNLADVAIVCGTGLLLVDAIRSERHP